MNLFNPTRNYYVNELSIINLMLNTSLANRKRRAITCSSFSMLQTLVIFLGTFVKCFYGITVITNRNFISSYSCANIKLRQCVKTLSKNDRR